MRDLTEGRGVDCAVVAAGATAAVELAPAARAARRHRRRSWACRRRVRLVEFEPAALAHDGIRILGSKLGSARPAIDLPALADLYLEGRLRLDELISSRFPLTAINDALGVRGARRGPARRDRVLSSRPWSSRARLGAGLGAQPARVEERIDGQSRATGRAAAP